MPRDDNQALVRRNYLCHNLRDTLRSLREFAVDILHCEYALKYTFSRACLNHANNSPVKAVRSQTFSELDECTTFRVMVRHSRSFGGTPKVYKYPYLFTDLQLFFFITIQLFEPRELSNIASKSSNTRRRNNYIASRHNERSSATLAPGPCPAPQGASLVICPSWPHEKLHVRRVSPNQANPRCPNCGHRVIPTQTQPPYPPGPPRTPS